MKSLHLNRQSAESSGHTGAPDRCADESGTMDHGDELGGEGLLTYAMPRRRRGHYKGGRHEMEVHHGQGFLKSVQSRRSCVSESTVMTILMTGAWTLFDSDTCLGIAPLEGYEAFRRGWRSCNNAAMNRSIIQHDRTLLQVQTYAIEEDHLNDRTSQP